jgi:hypothetical protein
MTPRSANITPSLSVDDGIVFIFTGRNSDGTPFPAAGFLRQPISATSQPTGNPPLTWSLTSDPSTWVETLKYASRNQKQRQVEYDDDPNLAVAYKTTAGDVAFLVKLYSVTG